MRWCGSDPSETSTSVGVAETWTSVQPKRSSESQDPVLEVGGRVAGLVADTHEPDQELDGRVRRLER